MKYKAFKRSLVTAGLGIGLWYGAAAMPSSYESTPGRLIDSALSRRSTIEAIVDDIKNSSPVGLLGKTLTYGGLAAAGLSVFASSKKKKEE